MTVKLALLKSGEDVISDIQEMVVVDDDGREKIIGYFFTKPCVVKLLNPDNLSDEKGNKAFEISMFPWFPLSKDTKIPVTADWVVTLVEPIEKLKTMYTEGVLDYGKRKDSSFDEQSNSDISD
jgi:hypothetical protein